MTKIDAERGFRGSPQPTQRERAMTSMGAVAERVENTAF